MNIKPTPQAPQSPVAPEKTKQTQGVPEEDIQWAINLESKVKEGHQPTEDEIAKYKQIADALIEQQQGEVKGAGKKEAQKEAQDSTKGLLDYPKDLVVGLTNFTMKSFGTNAAEFEINKESMKDNFSDAWDGLKKGKLDDTIENTIEGFGDLFSVAADGVQGTLAAMAGTVGLAASGVLDGVDEAAEWAGDKLAANKDNEWSKTGASIVRLVGGENSNENIIENFNGKIVEGAAETLKKSQ